jgi:hypothetical protein
LQDYLEVEDAPPRLHFAMTRFPPEVVLGF